MWYDVLPSGATRAWGLASELCQTRLGESAEISSRLLEQPEGGVSALKGVNLAGLSSVDPASLGAALLAPFSIQTSSRDAQRLRRLPELRTASPWFGGQRRYELEEYLERLVVSRELLRGRTLFEARSHLTAATAA